jgi:uroporphyrinogen-III synthase
VRGIERQRVLVLEARLSGVLSDLVARAGGEPVSVPAVAEVEARPDEVADALHALCAVGVDLVILMTGVGADRLHRQASALGLGDAFLRALEQVPIVVRGPKPTAVLHRWAIRPTHSAPSPHTTAEVCRVLDALSLAGTRVFVQHYGQFNEALRTYLHSRQAETIDALPYRWALPDEGGPLLQAAHGLVGAQFDAMLVTSQPQVINLFAVAERAGLTESLREALNTHVAVAAVGPTARAALTRLGVRVVVEPSQPKMVPLVRALADHARGSSDGRTSGGGDEGTGPLRDAGEIA